MEPTTLPQSGPETAPRLHLPSWIEQELRRAAAAGYPEEVCGVLLGHHEEGMTETVAIRQVANRNRDRARDRFDMDPAELLAVDREARSLDLDVVGIWHTHPDHPARPSETDRAAAWEGWSYVIVAVTGEGAGELRSWRLAGDRFHEETIVREEGIEP